MLNKIKRIVGKDEWDWFLKVIKTVYRAVSRDTKSTAPGGGGAAKGQKRKSGLHQELFSDSCFLKGMERDLRLIFSLPWGSGLGLALGLGLGDRGRQSQVQWDWKRDARSLSCTKNTPWQLLPLGYRRGFWTKPQLTWILGVNITISRETKPKVVDAVGLQGSCQRKD